MIRPAQARDAAPIGEIWNPIIRNSGVTFNSVEKSSVEIAEMIATRQADGHGFWVAEQDGKLLGFATYAQFRGGIGYAHTMEHTIVLSDMAKGKGIGRALLAELEAHARSKGVHSLFAGVSSANPDGVLFHQALGFQTLAVLPEVGWKFDQWLDLHLMQKFL
jgi:phosphinothricin acetyltransferase